jgi:hypothetical protein
VHRKHLPPRRQCRKNRRHPLNHRRIPCYRLGQSPLPAQSKNPLARGRPLKSSQPPPNLPRRTKTLLYIAKGLLTQFSKTAE